MTKHREGFNPPGLKSWRRTSLATLGKLTDRQIQRQETAYIAWLAEAYGVRTIVAEAHARSQQYGDLVSSTIETAPRESEERISEACIIRTVRCWTAKPNKHWNPAAELWQPVYRADAPTHYRVEMNGRPVNSFHSITRARSWALAQIAA